MSVIQPEVDAPRGRRLLLVEADPGERSLLRQELAGLGFDCEEGNRYEDVLDTLRSTNDLHALILFCGGNAAAGLDTVLSVKREHPQLPVAYLPALLSAEDADKCKAANVTCASRAMDRSALLGLVTKAMSNAAADGPSSSPVAAAAPDPERPLRILEVDDHWDNRMLMKAYLQNSPHELELVEDGKCALDYLEEHNVDLVFMDLQMPVMDGLTATTRIREMERKLGKSPMPILALTANVSPRDREASHQAGCTAFLAKPLSRKKLLDAIREYGFSMKAAAEVPLCSQSENQ